MTRIGFVRRAILNGSDQGAWAALWATLAVAAPVAARMALSSWVSGLPFLTFFPAVLVATIFLGWRWGALVLAASAITANYMFQPPLMAFALTSPELVATGSFIAIGALIVWAAEALRRSVIQLEAASRREAELNLELQHRVNNNLALMQALARQTARHAPSVEAFYTTFSERLLAVSEANRVLSRPALDVAVLPELVEVALKPFQGKGTISIDGPLCRLPTNACVPLVLALHELGTNATKYGALSVPSGCVRVQWTVEDGRCRMNWREERGPPVTPPIRRGLGSRLLRTQAGLDGVGVEFPPGGVTCEIVMSGAVAEAAGSAAPSA